MGVLSKPQASPGVHTLLAGWGASQNRSRLVGVLRAFSLGGLTVTFMSW